METITTETAKLVANLAITGIQPVAANRTTHLLVPPEYKHIDITEAIEKAQPEPNRLKGAVTLGDLDSLLTYMTDQGAQATGYVYADPDSRTITTIFNDTKAGANWRDHRASYTATLTPEAKRWLDHDGKQFGQTEFAEFIEDNFADLHGEDAQTLLEVATTISATTGINFSSAKRLQDGQTQLTYNEVIDAKAGSTGAITIPKTFTLGLRLFKNGGGYKLTARLKYRLTGGGVKFFYELDRPEKAIDDAFAGYIDQVRNATVGTGETAKPLGYTVLIGRA
jgi:uncharacterized protein YfdQ (DUF2303 family)